MIPEYSRPDSPVSEKWLDDASYGKIKKEGKNKTAVDLDWSKFFKDPKLGKIIETALENNRDLKTSALNVERTRLLYRIKRNDFFPKVNASGSASRQRIPEDLSPLGHSDLSDEFGLNLGVSSWEIDFFGRLRSLEKKALEQYFSTEYARRGAQVVLISEVANAYLNLAKDRENHELARSTLEAQKASYNLIKKRFEKGLATELDLRQAQTRVDSAMVDEAKFTELILLDINALNLLSGTNIEQDYLPLSLTGLPGFEALSPGTSSEVLLNRPDILQAESLLKAANANIGAARASFFPRITLTSTIGTASDELSELFRSNSATWLFSSGISIPVFNPDTWSNLKISKVEKEIALTKYERAIRSAFKDVSDALAGKATLDLQLNAQKSLVDALKEAHRLSEIRYKAGTGEYLNVLDSQRSLYSAQQGLIFIEHRIFANQVQLYAAMGGGGNIKDSDEKEKK